MQSFRIYSFAVVCCLAFCIVSQKDTQAQVEFEVKNTFGDIDDPTSWGSWDQGAMTAPIDAASLYSPLETRSTNGPTSSKFTTPSQLISPSTNEFSVMARLSIAHDSSRPPCQKPLADHSIVKVSAAYIVCDSLGLDTSDYSFVYLASWADEPQELISAADCACKLADKIMGQIDT